MSNLFKLYTDKSSILKKNSRYVQGGTTDIFANRLGWWEKRDDIPTNQLDDKPIFITASYARRPDKIAFDNYGRTDLAWLVLQYNSIVDINTELIAGVTIMIPSVLRTFSDIVSNNVQFQPIE